MARKRQQVIHTDPKKSPAELNRLLDRAQDRVIEAFPIQSFSVPHIELYLSRLSKEAIKVACGCRLSIDHSYAEWLALPENSIQSIRARKKWATHAPNELTPETDQEK